MPKKIATTHAPATIMILVSVENRNQCLLRSSGSVLKFGAGVGCAPSLFLLDGLSKHDRSSSQCRCVVAAPTKRTRQQVPNPFPHPWHLVDFPWIKPERPTRNELAFCETFLIVAKLFRSQGFLFALLARFTKQQKTKSQKPLQHACLKNIPASSES